jgi:hypothetical protein
MRLIRSLLLCGLASASALAAASGALAQTAEPAAKPAAAPAAQSSETAAPQAQPPAEAAPQAQPADSSSTKTEAPADKVGVPPAGKALVVFYRPLAPGMLLGFTIREGATEIAKVGSSSYQVVQVDPGPHAFTLKSEVTDTLRIEADAGEVYYVKQTMHMGLVVGRPHLDLSDKASFEKVSAHYRVSKFVPAPAPTTASDAKPAVQTSSQ